MAAKLRKIVQIAQIVKDLKETMSNYYSYMGIGPWHVYTFVPPGLRESTYRVNPSDHTYKLAIAWVGDTQLELIQLISGDSLYNEYLEQNLEGLHHIKKVVVNCQDAIEKYKSNGIEVIQSGKYDEDEFYYLDTEKTLGVIYEIENNGKIRSPEEIYPKINIL